MFNFLKSEYHLDTDFGTLRENIQKYFHRSLMKNQNLDYLMRHSRMIFKDLPINLTWIPNLAKRRGILIRNDFLIVYAHRMRFMGYDG